jgi:hypothetical protein
LPQYVEDWQVELLQA